MVLYYYVIEWRGTYGERDRDRAKLWSTATSRGGMRYKCISLCASEI